MFGEHLEGRDLIIATCAPAIAESVAEITLAQLIIGLRRTLQNGVDNRSGPTRSPANSHTLFQSTVGVVGTSEVGRRVVRNLRPFGPRILLYDPFVSASEAQEMGAELVADLMELCRRSDAVTLHTPPLPSTACSGHCRMWSTLRTWPVARMARLAAKRSTISPRFSPAVSR